MSQGRIILAILMTSLALPGAAAAAGGNGLYEPFPRPAARQAASDFARIEALRLTPSDLAAGRFVGADGRVLQGAGTDAPSLRAGVGGASAASLLWAVAAILALAAAGGVRVARRHKTAT